MTASSPFRPSSAVTSADLRATPDYDVDLTLDNLVALGDELCADSVTLCDDEVTFTRRDGAGVTRWRGVVGTRGLVRV